MRKTKKTLAILALVAMVLTMIPLQVFAATTSATDATRLGGADRVATAIAIADAGFTSANTVIVAPADDANVVDALAAAPLAGKTSPILLAYKDGSSNASVQAEITKLGAKNVYLVGAAASDAIANGLTGVTITKLAGADRIATAALINAKLSSPAGTFVVGYNGTPDALSVASYAAANNYAIVLTNVDGTVDASKLVGSKTYLVGGTGVVKDYAGATRFGGADRYLTNQAVIKGLTYSYDKVYVANGESLVDALAAAPVAALANAPIALTDNSAVAAAADINANLTADSVVIALGGTGVVSDTVKALVGYQAPATLAVSSVSAINAKEIQVVFNKPVDSDSAEDVTNYTFRTAGQSSDTAFVATGTGSYGASASLADDGVTLTITLDNALKSAPYNLKANDIFTLKVTDGVKDTSGNYITETKTNVTYSDSTAPTVVSITSTAKTSTTSATITFSEPVDRSAATVTINGKFASLSAGSKPRQVKVTSADTLYAGQSYTLVLAGFQDYAGNVMTPNPVTETLNVATDTTAPTVTNVNVVRDSLIEVTFSEKMDDTTIAGTTNLNLLDGNLSTSNRTLGTVAVKSDTNSTVYQIPISALTWNSNNQFTGFVSYNDSIHDAAGNSLVAGTTAVTITKDASAPSIVSSVYKNVSSYNGISTANGAIVVKYNEKLNIGSGTYTIMDQNGNTSANTFGTPQINPNDATELVLPLGSAIASNTTTYMIVIPKGAVTDKSLSANKNSAANVTVDVSVGGPTGDDTTKPTITLGTVTPAHDSTTGSTITVNVSDAGGSGLDLTTVANTSNYQLNGSPLPSGSYVTFASGVATIIIPGGSITQDGQYSLSVAGIKDKAGNTANTIVFAVNLNDDTKPVLTTATLNSDGTVTVGFSEKVKTVANSGGSSAVAGDLVVKVNGTQTSGITVADGAGADNGKYVVTVTGVDLNTVNGLSVGIQSTPTVIKDQSNVGNVVKASTTITVK